MRVLLVVAPITTHILPIIPLAWALSAAGHQVLCVGEPTTADAARAAGLHTVELDLPADAGPPPPKPAAQAPSAAGWQPDWDTLAVRWRARVSRVIDRHLEIAREWRPDVVICDPIEFNALVIGGALGIPTVVHRWGPDALTSQTLEPARRALREICERVGVPDGLLPAPAMVLDPCPPTMQTPEATPGTPVRFVPYNGPGSLSSWTPKPDAKTVCVTYSGRTVVESGIEGIAALARSFDGLDGVQGLITLGTEHWAALGAVPDNVTVVPPAPLSLLLDRCDVLAHHGGSGTGLTGFAFGLPQVVLPPALPGLDVYADRLVTSGAGIAVPAQRQRDPEAIAAALSAVVREERYTVAATGLRDQMLALPAPADLVPTLVDLAARDLVSAG